MATWVVYHWLCFMKLYAKLNKCSQDSKLKKTAQLATSVIVRDTKMYLSNGAESNNPSSHTFFSTFRKSASTK